MMMGVHQLRFSGLRFILHRRSFPHRSILTVAGVVVPA